MEQKSKKQKKGQCPNCKEFKLTKSSTVITIFLVGLSSMWSFIGMIMLIFFWPLGLFMITLGAIALFSSIPMYFITRNKAQCMNCNSAYTIDRN